MIIRRFFVKKIKIIVTAFIMTVLLYEVAAAGPTAQINIPSTDAKGFKELSISVNNYTRFSSRSDAGTNLYNIGFNTGLFPFDRIKLEVGADYNTSGQNSWSDNHPFSFNAKLATAEDTLISGLPAFAVGIYNLGTYDKPEVNGSTRQNILYGLAAKTIPIVGRMTIGGYLGSERALATSGNPRNNNSGFMASWDHTISELSDKLWLGADYMSGNNPNGEVSVGASWSFSNQITLLVGVIWYNPFYKLSASDGGEIPGGKPAFTTQLTINLP
jgi:hypothetical protein